MTLFAFRFSSGSTGKLLSQCQRSRGARARIKSNIDRPATFLRSVHSLPLDTPY